jgi:hypothetical protein
MEQRGGYKGGYQAERRELLKDRPKCAYCPRRATTADHEPPLSLHHHRQRSGCCVLVPSCRLCACRQGGYLTAARFAHPLGSMPIATDPPGFDFDSVVWDQAKWLDGLRDVPADGWWPRLMTVPHPDAVGSYGDEIVAWAKRERGITMFWWQRLVVTRLAEHDANGELCWRDFLLSVARQSGKSVTVGILCEWRSEQAGRFGEPQLVMHTADTIMHAVDVWTHGLVRAGELDYKVRRSHGAEAILHHDGSSWHVRSNTGVVGYTTSFGVIDECHGVKLATVTENLSPSLVEAAQSQMMLVSTAHSQCTDLFPTYRLQATSELAEPSRLLILEWSADPGLDLADPIAARQSSPHWSKGRERDIADAIARAMGTPVGHELRIGAEAQWLNRWPSLNARSGPGELLIPEGSWEACEGSLGAPAAGWVALEDNFGHGAAVALVAGEADRFEVDGVLCAGWSEAVLQARKFLEASPGSRLIVGASMLTYVPFDMPGAPRPAINVEARRGLSVLRSLVADRRIVHDRTADLDKQILSARVRPASDGMQLAGEVRRDLLKALCWALFAAQQGPPGSVVR